MTILSRIALLIALATPVFAAGIDGVWLISRETPRGPMELQLELKAEGEKLTGTLSGPGGRGRQIEDGEINGDEFEFSTVMPGKRGDVKMTWTGKVVGDELQGRMSREGGAGEGRPFTAKRK